MVSQEPAAAELAAAAGAELVDDFDDASHSAAALAGIAARRGRPGRAAWRCCPGTARCSTRASSTGC